MYSKGKQRRNSMSTFKIRLVTAPNQDTFYRRMNVPRESYVDITETNRVQLKHGGNKWKAHLSASDPDYIKEKQDLISGLVFNSRKDAEIFMKPCYFMRFDKSGNVIESKEQKEEYWYDEDDGEDSQGNFYVSVVTDNEEKAIKIGAERRSMRLAQKNGL